MGLQFSIFKRSLFGFGINVIIPCLRVIGSSPFKTDSLNTANKKGAILELNV